MVGRGQGLEGQKPVLRLREPQQTAVSEDLPKRCSQCDYCPSLKRRLMGELHSLDVEEEDNGGPAPHVL